MIARPVIGRRTTVATLFGAAALLAGACSDSGTGPDAKSRGAAVTISPRETSVDVGSTTTLTASASDAQGNALPATEIFWSSEDTALAAVSAQGVVTAKKAGTVRIAASVAGVSDIATVTIRPQPVAKVNVSQASAQIQVGQTVRLAASPVNSAGEPLTDRTVTWRSSNDAIARVDTAGLVTGIAPGAAIVTASSGDVSTQVAVTVSAIPVSSIALSPSSASLVVGQSAQLSATALDASGSPLRDRVPFFTSSNEGVATVSSSGLVIARAPGSATVTALAEGKSATASVTVAAVPASAVIVSPSTPQILVGQSTALSAQVTDASGNVLNGRTVTFSSDNPAVATVTSTGSTTANVTGVTAGTTTIRATSEGKTGTATVTVRPVPVASVSVAPSSPTLIVGAQTTLTAVTKDASGNTLSGRTVTWSTNNPAVATVSGSGVNAVVTAVGPGTAIISAASEGVVGQGTVTVTLVPVASVTVSPSSSSLMVGASTQLNYTLRDASGNVLTGREVDWTSSDNKVALVSSGGLVTAVGAGSATITAASEGKSGSATVTVAAPTTTVASVTVTPVNPTVKKDTDLTLTAVCLDAAGSSLSGQTVTWSKNPSSGMTSSFSTTSGVTTATGTTTVLKVKEVATVVVTATCGGKTASTTVTITS